MNAEPSRSGRLGTAARALGVLCAVGFVALLGYGIIAQSPDTTIDDALAAQRAPAAPGFRLPVLTREIRATGCAASGNAPHATR